MLATGAPLGPYEIVGSLGAGGRGEVYRARDTRLGREVAVKVLPEAFTVDADRLRRFEQEARTLAALNHPNILSVHDVGTEGGATFIVTELLERATLRERLARERRAGPRGPSGRRPERDARGASVIVSVVSGRRIAMTGAATSRPTFDTWRTTTS